MLALTHLHHRICASLAGRTRFVFGWGVLMWMFAVSAAWSADVTVSDQTITANQRIPATNAAGQVTITNTTIQAPAQVQVYATKQIVINPGLTVAQGAGLTLQMVTPVLTTFTISPTPVTVSMNTSRAFTATTLDQTGSPMVPSPAITWSVTGSNTINSSGVFTAASTAGTFVVTARIGTATATASVSVTALPTIAIAATQPTATEFGTGTGLFTISRFGPTTAALTVNLTRAGTATNGVDYALLPPTVTFPIGTTSVTLPVLPIDDTLAEINEAVLVTIAAGTGYAVTSPSNASVTITDNEPPTVSIAATDTSASEPLLTSGNGVFTITRTGPTSAPITVTYAITGTATMSSDYTSAPVGTTLTILAGSATATITVIPLQDTILEPDESVIVTIQPVAGYAMGAVAATVTILDDESPVFTVVAKDASASETGTDTGQFQINRLGNKAPVLTANYTISGTATSGTDFTALSGTLAFAANAVSGLITVTPITDTIAEGDETVIMTLATGTGYSVGTPAASTVIIRDDEWTVHIAATDAVAFEPTTDTGTFTITRTGIASMTTATALTVAYTVSGTATAGADYATLTGTVTIPAAVATVTIIVTPMDDTLVEGPETVIVTLSPSSLYLLGATAIATVTIGDNDPPPPTVSMTTPDTSAAEAALDPGRFTITRTGVTTAALTVTYVITGTATAGTDYVSLSGTVTIPIGAASANVDVTPIEDALSEASETVILTLPQNPLYILGATKTGTVTIKDNEPIVVTVAASDASASEPAAGKGTGAFTLARTGSLVAALTVNLTTTGTATPGSDYTALLATATFAANGATAIVTVTPLDDTGVEDAETVILTVASGSGYSIGATPTATVTIEDDEPSVITIAATTPIAAEAAAVKGSFTITRRGNRTVAQTVPLTVTGTATSATDFTALGASIALAANISTATLTVTPVNDTVVEGPETVVVTLASGTGFTIGSPGSATVTILDDEPAVTIIANDPDAAWPSDQGLITIRRSGALTAALTVNLTISGTAASGTHYTALPTSVLLPAASAGTVLQILPLIGADSIGDKTVQVTLAAGTGYAINAPSAATITVHGRQPVATPTIDLAAGTYNNVIVATATIASGAQGYYTLDGSAPDQSSTLITGPITIDRNATLTVRTFQTGYLPSNPVSATYILQAATPVLSPASGSSGLTPFIVTATSASSGVEFHVTTDGTTPTAASPILPSSGIALSDGNITVSVIAVRSNWNSSGVTSASYVVTLPQAAAPILSPVSGTTATGSLTLTATSPSAGTTLCYTTDGSVPQSNGLVWPTTGLTLTADATVTVRAFGAAWMPSPITVGSYIITPTIAFTVDHASVGESDGSATVVVQLSDRCIRPVTVAIAASGTASTADRGSIPSLISIPAGQQQVSFTIPITADFIHEPDETIILTLSSPSGAALGAFAQLTETIVDDDPIYQVTIGLAQPSSQWMNRVGPGSTTAFAVTVRNAAQQVVPNLPVTWNATSGAMSATGVFTASAALGPATLSAFVNDVSIGTLDILVDPLLWVGTPTLTTTGSGYYTCRVSIAVDDAAIVRRQTQDGWIGELVALAPGWSVLTVNSNQNGTQLTAVTLQRTITTPGNYDASAELYWKETKSGQADRRGVSLWAAIPLNIQELWRVRLTDVATGQVLPVSTIQMPFQGTRQFTASLMNQWGATYPTSIPQSQFNWTMEGPATVSTAGLVTAGDDGGFARLVVQWTGGQAKSAEIAVEMGYRPEVRFWNVPAEISGFLHLQPSAINVSYGTIPVPSGLQSVVNPATITCSVVPISGAPAVVVPGTSSGFDLMFPVPGTYSITVQMRTLAGYVFSGSTTVSSVSQMITFPNLPTEAHRLLQVRPQAANGMSVDPVATTCAAVSAAGDVASVVPASNGYFDLTFSVPGLYTITAQMRTTAGYVFSGSTDIRNAVNQPPTIAGPIRVVADVMSPCLAEFLVSYTDDLVNGQMTTAWDVTPSDAMDLWYNEVLPPPGSYTSMIAARFLRAGPRHVLCAVTDAESATSVVETDVQITPDQCVPLVCLYAPQGVIDGRNGTITCSGVGHIGEFPVYDADQNSWSTTPEWFDVVDLPLSWSVDGGGSIDQNGVFTPAVGAAGPVTITVATASGIATHTSFTLDSINPTVSSIVIDAWNPDTGLITAHVTASDDNPLGVTNYIWEYATVPAQGQQPAWTLLSDSTGNSISATVNTVSTTLLRVRVHDIAFNEVISDVVTLSSPYPAWLRIDGSTSVPRHFSGTTYALNLWNRTGPFYYQGSAVTPSLATWTVSGSGASCTAGQFLATQAGTYQVTAAFADSKSAMVTIVVD
ncbi:MAG: Calx-beta domain-containing protein, partial [Planctomycetota bacterium]